ncbi:MAG TPA: hypothetical protein VNK46_07895 [Nitrospiraceae bacterium]|jgi:hypothetical protein|nr:hypothetical protein [Nitrospiraceae bacterium]
MKRHLRIARTTGLIIWVLLATTPTLAGDITIIQGSDGTTGTVYDFGGIKLYHDSHGTRGTIYDFGGISTYQFTGPGGETRAGTIFNFGLPPPPNNFTPAPILPFNPHGALMPRESPPPVASFTPRSGFGVFSGSGSGRPGR